MLAWIEGRTEITQKRMHGQTKLTNIYDKYYIFLQGKGYVLMSFYLKRSRSVFLGILP